MKEILKEYCTEEELEKIAAIVRYHTLEKVMIMLIIKKVTRMPMFGSFGTIGVWLDFHYYAYHDLPMEKAVEIYEQEYEKQISKVRELLNYEISKKYMMIRLSFVGSFLGGLPM